MIYLPPRHTRQKDECTWTFPGTWLLLTDVITFFKGSTEIEETYIVRVDITYGENVKTYVIGIRDGEGHGGVGWGWGWGGLLYLPF